MLRLTLISLATAALLPGCAAISALSGAATSLENYDLAAPADAPQARRTIARQMVVEVPTAPGALMSERIMIRPRPLQAQYLPDGQWASEAPVMLQTLIVRTLEDSNAFRYVGRRPIGSFGDFVLVSELTDLQAEAQPDGPGAMIRVRLTARLVRESDAAVVATRTFNAAGVSATTETIDLVEGFNTATQSMLRDLSTWVLGAVGAGVR
ncbi:MAG: ABC-type transport auxiliary lipoprotein family protein [Pseudorhodobacter sp.]